MSQSNIANSMGAALQPRAVNPPIATLGSVRGFPGGGEIVKTLSWKPGDGILVFALAALGLTFPLPQVGLAISMTLAAMIIIKANPVHLPALMICQLHANDFQIQNYGTMDYWVSRFEDVNLFIAGFPVTTNYVILIAMLLRIVHELVAHTSRLRLACPLWTVVLWLISLLPAIAIATTAFFDRVPSWTLSVRMALMTGGFFYGAILGSRWSDRMEYVWSRLLLLATGLMLAAFRGVFWARALFVLDAYGPTLGYVAFRHRNKILGVLAIVATLLYVTGSGKQEASFRTHGNVSTTVTLIATCFSALALLFLFYRRPARPSRLIIVGGTIAVVAITAMLPVVAGFTYRDRRVDAEFGEHMPLAERAYYKIFNERAPIWKGAIDKITTPPFFLPKAGEALIVDWGGQSVRVGFGSHNAYLDQLRVNGWFTGLFGVLVMLAALATAWTALNREANPYFRAIAAGVLALGMISATANHFLTEVSAGIWYFLPGGMLAARLRMTKKQREPVSGNGGFGNPAPLAAN